MGFSFPETGNIPVLFHAVGAYTPGDADPAFEGFEEIVAGCSSFETDEATFNVAPVSFPELGDESIPLLFSGEIEGFNVSFYFVITRVSDGIGVVGYGGLAPDVGEVERYARLATRKLRQAQDASP